MPRASHYHPQVRHEYKTNVVLETADGSNYREAFTEAVHVASRLEREIVLTFNGVTLGVIPGSTVDALVEEFCAKYLALRSTQVST